MGVVFLPSGDCGLTVQFGLEIDRALSGRIMALRASVEAAGLRGVIETVPTYRSLLIHYDPLQTSQKDLIAAIEPLLGQTGERRGKDARHWRLPACFDADFSPDLETVATHANLSREAVIEQFLSVEQFIYMLGFAPGMPYMGDLPDALHLPRKEKPTPHVEKGSILIATGLTVLYPVPNPTGWHIIGRCPVPIFDLEKAEPVLLSPGDYISFQRVDRRRFDEISEQYQRGLYQIDGEARP